MLPSFESMASFFPFQVVAHAFFDANTVIVDSPLSRSPVSSSVFFALFIDADRTRYGPCTKTGTVSADVLWKTCMFLLTRVILRRHGVIV